MKTPDTVSSSYLLEIDGNQCFTVGGGSILANSWTWVDYQDGTPATKIDVPLAQGNHTIRLIGSRADVRLDRLVLSSDPNCVPAGMGSSCGDTEPPTTPSGLSAVANSSSQISLAWTASTDAVSYDIYQSRSGGAYQRVRTVTVTNAVITGLSANTLYSFFVKARDSAGNESAASNIATAKTRKRSALALSDLPIWNTASMSVNNFPAALEAEQGTLSGSAQVVADAAASGGQAVKFGSTSGGPPKPDANNTGVDPSIPLTDYTGPSANNESNVTYANVNFPVPTDQGWYVFYGDNLTFRNCRINGGGIVLEGDNIRIEHCTIAGGVSLNNTNGATIIYNNIHSWEDGLHITADPTPVRNVTFSYNYVHTPRPACGAHSDGVQLIGVDGFTAEYNNIDMGPQFDLCGDPWPLNGTFQIKTDFNGVLNQNFTLNHNWLNGGGYTLRIYQCASSTVTNNRFGRQHTFGPTEVTATNCFLDTSGNVYDDNDEPITF